MPKLNRSCFLRVFIAKDDDAGLWVAHCLDLDVVSHGSTPKHAAEAVSEAICMVVDDDLARDADPLTRQRAPEECWRPFAEALMLGTPAQDFDVDATGKESSSCFACLMKVIRPYHSALDGDEDSDAMPLLVEDFHLPIPEAWEIAAMRRTEHALTC